MAASLIETMAADFEPEKGEDDYQIQLKELIEAKVAPRASVKDRGGEAVASDRDDDEGRLPPPVVGYTGGGSGFNVGSKAFDFEAPPSSARTDVVA